MGLEILCCVAEDWGDMHVCCSGEIVVGELELEWGSALEFESCLGGLGEV